MKVKLLLLIVGLGAGAALMHLYGDQAWQLVGLQGREVEANVLEIRRDDDGRLVLMLDSEGESMLATYTERAEDIASLVHAGDIVTFRVAVDGVFSDDVPLLSVRRPEREAPAEGDNDDQAVEAGEEVGEEVDVETDTETDIEAGEVSDTAESAAPPSSDAEEPGEPIAAAGSVEQSAES